VGSSGSDPRQAGKHAADRGRDTSPRPRDAGAAQPATDDDLIEALMHRLSRLQPQVEPELRKRAWAEFRRRAGRRLTR
jgi:hypothetical protein